MTLNPFSSPVFASSPSIPLFRKKKKTLTTWKANTSQCIESKYPYKFGISKMLTNIFSAVGTGNLIVSSDASIMNHVHILSDNE